MSFYTRCRPTKWLSYAQHHTILSIKEWCSLIKIRQDKTRQECYYCHCHNTVITQYLHNNQLMQKLSTKQTINVGQCPTWWPPCRIQVAPSAQRRKVWLTPTTRVPCSNAAKTRTCWTLQGCPKQPKRSQPLVGRSSPYCGHLWRRYCSLASFFPIVDTCLNCENIARQICATVPRWRFFGSCISSEPRAPRFRHAS